MYAAAFFGVTSFLPLGAWAGISADIWPSFLIATARLSLMLRLSREELFGKLQSRGSACALSSVCAATRGRLSAR
jgi:hypothetical protein